MTSFPDRERVDLAGVWQCEPLARTELHPAGEIVESTADLPAPGTMPVPSSWHDHLGDFHGRVRFSRTLPPLDGGGWWVCFSGADYFTQVLADGRLLAGHEGAFDGFAIRLPAAAAELEVVVDAPREHLGSVWPYRKRQLKGIFTQWEPLEPFQATTGGIWGDVWAERRPAAHIQQVAAGTYLVPRAEIAPDGQYTDGGCTDARVVVEVDVHADAATTATLSAQLCGATSQRTVTLPAGTSRHRIAVTLAEPELWWPRGLGEPVLHDLVVRLGDDRAVTPVGLREVSFDEATGHVTVNGTTVTLRASNVVPEKWLGRYSAQRARDDVDLICAANLNAVRVCVHVAHETFYDALDEAGVLVWQDLPLQWDYEIDDTLVVQAADQAERIVRRLRNHASIALWSCHNEPFEVNRRHFAGPLLAAVRAADATRSVHPASDFTEHAYHGWFSGDAREHALPTPAPFVSEFGAIGLPSAQELKELGVDSWPPGGRAWDAILHEPSPLLDVAGIELPDTLDELVDRTQRYQARLVQRAIEAYRTRRMSYFHFLLMDGWPTVSWSAVSYDRVPKLAYDALARASQPLLIGADLTRDRLSDAWDSRRFPPLAAGIWVVNDTPDALPGARWRALLGGTRIADGIIDVQADAVSRAGPGYHGWPSWNPPDLAPGEHQLVLELADRDGDVRSRNRYPVQVTHRHLDLQPLR